MGDLLPFDSADPVGTSFGLIGSARWLAPLLKLAQRAAATDLPVLIVGETGTGKELLAEALHRLSGRPGEFVALDGGVVATDLVEAELFGSMRGAYTSAVDRPGLLEQAHRGTLFLDEACGLPLTAQAKLLRVLESHRVRRVGGRQERLVEFRLVLALQRPAAALVREGRWRADFWYRVNTVTLSLPPLRERRADVPLLVNHALGGLDRPALAPGDVARALAFHDWPGNVRELIRVVERAVFAAGLGEVTATHLAAQVEGSTSDPLDALPEEERVHLDSLLRRAGSTKAAAEELGMQPYQLYRRMKQAGVVPPRLR